MSMTNATISSDPARWRSVLDHGYVRLVEVYGDELTIVNAARASFHKEHTQFEAADARLLAFLVREGHWTPFRHVFGQFEIHAPLMVARQLWKYVVGSDHTMETAWSEGSRRYVTEDPVLYHPTVWRYAPTHRKQGSGDPVDPATNAQLTQALNEVYTTALLAYQQALDAGVAPEQARLFLPAYALYVTWRWTASLQALYHVFEERLQEDAQEETRVVVQAIRDLITPYFPHVLGGDHQ